eukprot:GFUD01035489.1.p1 GENE.GFUD01035489.1~~GFUD01035489.1.p1  ORF type:complete len:574 (-),score=164.16 GFUD01035489.1:136-1857(-)
MKERLLDSSTKARGYGSSVGTCGVQDTGEGMEHDRELQQGQFRNFGFDERRESCEAGIEKKMDRDRKESASGTDYETAIKLAGYGSFHYWLMFVCGWANASDAVEILCISFLLPSAECDLELTPARKGWLSAILFVGMMIGGYIWGSLGDTLGRRIVLINAMLVNAAAGFFSSFSQGYYIFLVLRFLSGVGVGGSIPVVWSYYAEFQPSAKRGAALSVLASFWMVGNVTVAGLAWAIIPHEIGWTDPASFQYNSWRIFVAISALPSFLVAIALVFMPESPRFLLCQGREEETLSVLRRIYYTNTGKDRASYPVTSLQVERVSPHIVVQKQDWRSSIKECVNKAGQLFSPALYRVTLIMLVINFAIQFGYYGLWLWFPELFNKLEQYHTLHPNHTASVCEVVSVDLSAVKELNSTATNFCTNTIPDNQVFINSFIISASAAPSNLWTILHMDKLGRRFFLCFSMLLSGCSAFFIYLVNSSTMNLILSCIFGAVSTMGFNSLDCLGIELFPTSLRSTAMALTLVAARLGAILGNLVFGYLVESHCAVPILTVAGLLIGGGFMGLLLPNTTQKPLL